MARKLKTYQTSLGFFELAIAAPSMRAALDAWGTKTNLFHQGIAKQAEDPAIVKAAMARPGVVLKRPVGTNGTFRVDAKLPAHLERATTKKVINSVNPSRSKLDKKSGKAAVAAYEREARKREQEARKETAARKRQDQMIAKVQAEIEKAEQAHEKRAAEIETELTAIEKRFRKEEARWDRERRKLNDRMRRARN